MGVSKDDMKKAMETIIADRDSGARQSDILRLQAFASQIEGWMQRATALQARLEATTTLTAPNDLIIGLTGLREALSDINSPSPDVILQDPVFREAFHTARSGLFTDLENATLAQEIRFEIFVAPFITSRPNDRTWLKVEGALEDPELPKALAEQFAEALTVIGQLQETLAALN